MLQCLDLALKGIQYAAPNPMVGCVIVYKNEVIGKGYHQKCGEAHAEVNAIENVSDKSLLKESTLYVNLEPCSHFGKTPPCADLIVKHQIPKVVIGCVDSYSKVSGKGLEKLKSCGIEVIVGILEDECLDLNKRFFTFHNKKRPYIILKWAETKDGFIDIDRTNLTTQNKTIDNWITTAESKKLVHKWRSEEAAIMIGTNTAINDNPELTVREIEGRSPIRVVLDLNLRLPEKLNVFDNTVKTIVFNGIKNESIESISFVKVDNNNILEGVLNFFYNENITSVIIEGGTTLLNAFIQANIWDEARQFIGNKTFTNGLPAPKLSSSPNKMENISTDILNTYINA